MEYKPAIIIPVFNHGVFMQKTVEDVAPYGLPIYITDDGSDDGTGNILESLAREWPEIKLNRLAENRGKGAAVMDAMERAWKDGVTHALQIDADGQHYPSDIPAFVELSKKHPEAVISGHPLFDESVPKARLYGRYLNHFWVWVETLSFSIKDSMCGFRVYPLKVTIPLIRKVRIPTRMDFDIAIIVRHVWKGIAVHNILTRVTYPEEGISHFDFLRDNVRISRTHALLVLGMLVRLPVLLLKKKWDDPGHERHWSKMTERGSLLGLKSVSLTYQVLGRRAALALLWPVTAYFFVTGKAARRGSMKYLKKVHEYFGAEGPLPNEPGLRDSFRHFYSFSKSGLDKLSAWSVKGTDLEVSFPQKDVISSIHSSGRGAVFIGAHLGNMEMSRAKAVSSGMSGINAVVFTDHAVRFNSVLRETNPDFDLNLIQVSSLGPETSIFLLDKIERGEMLFIMGDRTPPREGGRTVKAPFLGEPALFPQGPYILSHLLKCPVYLFFCIKEDDAYVIHIEPFSEKIELPRKERERAIESFASKYAARLEHYCGRAPMQWFNFFDFWSTETVK